MRDREQLLDVDRAVDRLGDFDRHLVERVTVDRPPLRIVRGEQVRLPVIAPPRVRWWNTVAFGWAITISLLGGVVLVAMAMGWIR